jgi:MFS family permease
VAAVANLNLSVANVALPDIGKEFKSGQTTIDLIAVAYSLGLAASVLWFGALGDRYGRKTMAVGGTILAIPFSLLAAFAPSDTVLIIARVGGGLSAGMAYPTTLALITALWSGPGRTRAIALWSGLGAAISALGPVCAGFLLEHFAWGSVFILTIPLAAVAIPIAWILVPSHVNETTEPVDNWGGIFSVVLVGSLIVSINFAPVPNQLTLTLVMAGIALVGLALFYLRERRAKVPLYDLKIASRMTFWPGATAGIIIFGSLMGAMFIGQQFLQNVLNYSTLGAGASILPAALLIVLVAPISARITESHGTRFCVQIGQVIILLGFLAMLFLWKKNISYWEVGLAYVLIGAGVGLAGPPTSNTLTRSVPVKRVGMASGTADLQRDLGGATMQSIMGAFLTAGYTASAGAQIASSGQSISTSVQNELTKSFSSAAEVAKEYPQYTKQIISGAQTAFLHGQQGAYLAGVIAVVIGTVVMFFFFPKKDKEHRLLASYETETATAPAQPDSSSRAPVAPAPRHA